MGVWWHGDKEAVGSIKFTMGTIMYLGRRSSYLILEHDRAGYESVFRNESCP